VPADGTRVVRAGLLHDGEEVPFLPGPTFAAPYRLTGEAVGRAYGYGRYGNPTWTAWEAALGELEEGEAVAFSSGMAAVSAALLPLLGPGDVLVAPADGYPGVRNVAASLARWGIEARLVPGEDEVLVAAMDGARVVWIESPTNPWLEVLDVPALIEAAHAAGALAAVDNTLATPLGQRPLALGADLSVASASKHLTGHSDLVLGYAVARDPALVAGVRGWRDQHGAIPGPMEAWLAHRSLATLDVRLRRQLENAAAIAESLASQPAAADVRHTGTLVSFTLADRATVRRVLAACELITEATSFGGVHTSAERRGRWGTDDVPEGFVRLSAGIEDAADLVADLERALAATG
jgi:cystathionine gamma-lyase